MCRSDVTNTRSAMPLPAPDVGQRAQHMDIRGEVAGQASGQSPASSGPRRPVLHGVGVGLTLLGVFVLGFLGYLYAASGIQEARAQSTLYPTLAVKLGNQVAPLGATTPGSPVALWNIPAIGIRNVIVVEGTSTGNL